jgi:hypothetical protein
MRPHPPLAFFSLLSAALMLGLCAPRAQAQTIPSPYRFIETMHGAGGFAGVFSENRGSLRLGPGGGPVIGGRYGIELTGPLALEGGPFLLFTDREVHDPRGAEAVEMLGTTSAVVAGLEARVRFTVTGRRTWRGLAPFVAAGGGLVGNLAGRSEMEADFEAQDQFSFGPSALGTLGAGSRWFPSERLSVRLEGVLNFWRLGTPQSFRQREELTEPPPQNEWTRAGAVLFGASLQF